MVFWVLLQGSLRNGNSRKDATYKVQTVLFKSILKSLPHLGAAKEVSKTKFTSTLML